MVWVPEENIFSFPVKTLFLSTTTLRGCLYEPSSNPESLDVNCGLSFWIVPVPVRIASEQALI